MTELSNLSSSQMRQNNGKITLHVDIRNNPLQSSCECYSFLKWFKSADIFIKRRNLSSTLSRTIRSLSDIDNIMVTLDGICFPNTWFYVNVRVECMIYLVITILSLLRRHKYRIYFVYLRLRHTVDVKDGSK